MFIKNYKSFINEFVNDLSKQEQEKFKAFIHAALLDKNPFFKLKKTPQNEILNEKESATFDKFLQSQTSITTADPKKSYLTSALVVVLKATRLCNLRCTYCHSWRSGPNQVMQFPMLLRIMHDAINMPGIRRVEFVWHGGETTLLSIEYFKKALWIQQQLKKSGQIISNSIQTNATRLNEPWVQFFKEHQFGIGVSFDGPPEINDKKRVTKSKKPTSHLIERGIKLLQQHKLPFAILSVIDDEICDIGAKRLLEYFDSLNITQVAILNAIPDNSSLTEVHGSYLTWDKYIAFMKDLFNLWTKKYQHKISIRELSALYNGVKTKEIAASVCVFAGHCMGEYITVEPNGDISACDKYIDDKQYFFGNLLQHKSLYDLLSKSKNLTAAIESQTIEYKEMERCKWNHICRGGCPHDLRLNVNFNKTHNKNCCGHKELLNHMEAYHASHH